jgi:hypothetical protein
VINPSLSFNNVKQPVAMNPNEATSNIAPESVSNQQQKAMMDSG